MEKYHFQNWAQTYECYPEKYFEPSNLDDLCSILSLAQNENKKIRLVGIGHSPSELCCTPDFLVSMKKFNRILNIDRELKTVLVEGGVTLKDLVDSLKNQNLAISVLPSIGECTMAGVISTSTHGSGLNYPVLADYVISLTLLTSDKRWIKCSRQENTDIFHAVIGGLGLLGIVLEMEIQCESYYSLNHLRYPLSFDDFIGSIDDLNHESDHFSANYFPYTDRVVVSSIDRTKIKPQKRAMTMFQKFSNCLLFYIFEFFYFLTLSAPKLVQYLNRITYQFFYSQVDYSIDNYERIAFYKHQMSNVNCYFYASEWFIPIENCSNALKKLRIEIEKNQIPAHLPVEIRFVKKDQFWLSPAFNRDSCAMNIICYRPYGISPDHRIYWQVFNDLMKSFGGRPHLAKDHSMTEHEMKKSFPKFDDFLNLRRRLDQKNIFVNEYVERVVGKRNITK